MSTPHLDPPHFQRLIALELVPSVLDGAVLECIVLGHGRGQDPDSVPSPVMELELPLGLFDPETRNRCLSKAGSEIIHAESPGLLGKQ